MLDKDLEHTLNIAYKEARDQRHEFITVEHLLLALLDNASASRVLRACGANLNTLHTNLAKFIGENSPMLGKDDSRDTQPTLGFQRVLQRAVFHVQSSGRKEVSGANKQYAAHTAEVLVCGGGVHNDYLMQRLHSNLGGSNVLSTAAVGLDPDYIEAIAFAWLAILSLPRVKGLWGKDQQ